MLLSWKFWMQFPFRCFLFWFRFYKYIYFVRNVLIAIATTRSKNRRAISFFFLLFFINYFSFKDLFGFFAILFIFRTICFFYPCILGDPENFLPANPLVTPVHIQPE